MNTTTVLDGIEVIEEGDGDTGIVIIHGWPDAHRLWDGTVAAPSPHCRCLRFTLPGYEFALTRPDKVARLGPRCPMLYLCGTRKPFAVHSPKWLRRLAAKPGSRVVPMCTGHWVVLDRPEAFQRELLAWLAPGAEA